jgi:hypothetical protein
MYIPDPIELMESRIERMMDAFVDEHTCMACGVTVDYELICMSPIGDGPAVCMACSGLTEADFNNI